MHTHTHIHMHASKHTCGIDSQPSLISVNKITSDFKISFWHNSQPWNKLIGPHIYLGGDQRSCQGSALSSKNLWFRLKRSLLLSICQPLWCFLLLICSHTFVAAANLCNNWPMNFKFHTNMPLIAILEQLHSSQQCWGSYCNEIQVKGLFSLLLCFYVCITCMHAHMYAFVLTSLSCVFFKIYCLYCLYFFCSFVGWFIAAALFTAGQDKYKKKNQQDENR